MVDIKCTFCKFGQIISAQKHFGNVCVCFEVHVDKVGRKKNGWNA